MLTHLREFLSKELELLGDQRRAFMRFLALGPLVATLEVVTVLAMYPVVSILTGQVSGLAKFQFVNELINAPKWLAAPAFAVLFVIRAISTITYQTSNVRLMTDIERSLRLRMFDTCLFKKPASELWGPGSGSSSTTISFVCHNWGSTGLAISGGLYQLVMSGLLLATFLALDPKTTLMAFGLLTCVFLVYARVFRRSVSNATKAELGSFDRMTTEVTDLVAAIREVRVLGCEQRFHDRMAVIAKTRAKASATLLSMQLLPRVFAEISMVVLVMLLAALAIYQTGNLDTFYPVLGVLGIAAIRLIPAFNQVVALVVQGRQHATYADRIFDFLATESRGHELNPGTQSASPPLSFSQALEFHNVRFAYDSNAEILRGMSFSIARGDLVALVGPSGSGKSTVADLISGFLSPTSGSIIVDGVDIAQRISAWRANIAYMPQTVYLIDGTIRANVALSGETEVVDDKRVREALSEAQLMDFVDSLPMGIETPVGENGIRLSGGQRQRLGLARALFFERNFVIFDEPTAALDPEATRRFIELLRRQRGRQTIMVITHSRDLASACDQVLVVGDGAIKHTVVHRHAS